MALDESQVQMLKHLQRLLVDSEESPAKQELRDAVRDILRGSQDVADVGGRLDTYLKQMVFGLIEGGKYSAARSAIYLMRR